MEGCATCGGPRKAKPRAGPTSKYCSRYCKDVAARQTVKVKRREAFKQVRPCIICGCDVVQNYRGCPVKTCSLTCLTLRNQELLKQESYKIRKANYVKAYNDRVDARTRKAAQKRVLNATEEYKAKRNEARKQRRLNDPDYREYENRRNYVKGNPPALAALRQEFAERKLQAALLSLTANIQQGDIHVSC